MIWCIQWSSAKARIYCDVLFKCSVIIILMTFMVIKQCESQMLMRQCLSWGYLIAFIRSVYFSIASTDFFGVFCFCSFSLNHRWSSIYRWKILIFIYLLRVATIAWLYRFLQIYLRRIWWTAYAPIISKWVCECVGNERCVCLFSDWNFIFIRISFNYCGDF